MQENTRVRALCCECGNLRMVSAKYAPRSDENRSFDGADHPRGWRMTGTLKCSECKTMTAHALLRDNSPDHRDYAEEKQWLTRDQLASRAVALTTTLAISDLTTEELRQLVALLTPAEDRLAWNLGGSDDV